MIPSLVVFDWDGTLSDTGAGVLAVLHALFEELGQPPPDEAQVRARVGWSLEHGLRALIPAVDERTVVRAARRYRELRALRAGGPAPLVRGAKDCLDALDAHQVMVAVATGKSRRGLEEALRAHGLHSRVCTWRCADDGPAKPSPEPLLDILEELGVGADAAWMVGDAEVDMAMARAAGVAGIAVRSGIDAEHGLRTHAPLAVIDSVAQLPSLLSPARGALRGVGGSQQ